MASQPNLSDLQKVRIVVVGDSGVGKTSLVHFICHDNVLKKVAWTAGCNAEVKLHTHPKGGRQFFVEIIDIGGNPKYQEAREIFYQQVNGVILVHDLTNVKSYANLKKWAREVSGEKDHDQAWASMVAPTSGGLKDLRASLGATPALIIGNKLDLVVAAQRKFPSHPDIQSMEASATMGVIDDATFESFLNKVIDRRYYSSEGSTDHARRSISRIGDFVRRVPTNLNFPLGSFDEGGSPSADMRIDDGYP